MKRYSSLIVILSLILVFGLSQGCSDKASPTDPSAGATPETGSTGGSSGSGSGSGSDSGSGSGSWPAVSTQAAPTCTIRPSASMVQYFDTITLTFAITNGPARISFSPGSGTCPGPPLVVTYGVSDSGGTCTTDPLRNGVNTFTLTVSDVARGSNSCSVSVYVGHPGYRVWNNTGVDQDFKFVGGDNDDLCRSIASNNQITTINAYLNRNELIRSYQIGSGCTGPSTGNLSYWEALIFDAPPPFGSGNGDGVANFAGTTDR